MALKPLPRSPKPLGLLPLLHLLAIGSVLALEEEEGYAYDGEDYEGMQSPATSEDDPPLWLLSGKFQGDIDGVDPEYIRKLSTPGAANGLQFNALRNKQLTWPNAIVPYMLDPAFTPAEVRLLQRAFRTYRRRTCIRFRPRQLRGGEEDYLNIVKGYGCYSQVGRTGGKQEISLGRGCLFNETVVHELMHSLGFWHEHSRADRDDHINIRWENILPGMDSQFDIVSSAIQDTMGERYDYRSIMHYGSTAFSRNGHNTIEAVVGAFTGVIGTAQDLSDMDVVKIKKLYRCIKRDPSLPVPARRFGAAASSAELSSALPMPLPVPMSKRKARRKGVERGKQIAILATATPPTATTPRRTTTPSPTLPAIVRTTTLERLPALSRTPTTPPPSNMLPDLELEPISEGNGGGGELPTSAELLETIEVDAEGGDARRGGKCEDHFPDCPTFEDYCRRASFFFIMRSYCPRTCGQCATRTGGVDGEIDVNKASSTSDSYQFSSSQE